MGDCIVKDMALAPGGRQKIEWARAHMPVLALLRKKFAVEKPFRGVDVALSIHLEAKTACLAELLAEGGARVTVTGSNPLSTQDDVAAALAGEGISVFARHGVTAGEYKEHLLRVLETRPAIIIDDGGDLVHLLHTERPDLAENVLGGAEETTTGVIRLEILAREGKLLFPMLAVNNARSKFLFDNRYGTGESVWSAVMRNTNLLMAGKTVVVAGYGWCGKGVALKAKGLGAGVVIIEVDPVRALEAHMDGHRVMSSLDAASLGDIFITVTGCRDVLRTQHFQVMKDGAILANAGHFDVEINLPELDALAQSRCKARENVEQFNMPDGRKLYLLASGRLVNLAGGDGHPVEIMDLSFGLQALSARYILENAARLQKKVWPVPDAIDREVAEIKLASLGIEIDRLSLEQKTYLGG